MVLTENLNTISDWILTKLKNRDAEIARYERAIPLLKQERVQVFYDEAAPMWLSLSDGEKAIISTQRPDLVELLEEQSAKFVEDLRLAEEARLAEEKRLTEEKNSDTATIEIN